ncbi:MAG: WecB/TagA/CpsF family glycosyltransferase [Chloroflexi bacterium]|nr:WecB/TagA/CpsF family glycosyltransferase [Chloroflexota bacterium]
MPRGGHIHRSATAWSGPRCRAARASTAARAWANPKAAPPATASSWSHPRWSWPRPASCWRSRRRFPPNVTASLSFLGTHVDDVTIDEAVEIIDGLLSEPRPHQVVTVNPEFVMAARRLPDFQAVLNHADLRVPDGVGLIWGSWLLRRPLRGRVPGVELVWRITELAAERGHALYLLGGFGGVADVTAERMRERFPAVRIAGRSESGPTDDGIVDAVRASGADVLLVAYGAPAQDLWIRDHAAELGVRLAVGVGGTFDYIAGRSRRAPGWLRRMGFEWLYRLAHEPWRWRRQLVLPRFAILMLRQRWTL